MTEHCKQCKSNPVEIARSTQGTTTAKLIAVLIASGITDTKELAEITGLKIRAVQAARNAAQCAQHNAPAQQDAPKTQHDAPNAPECAQHAAPLACATKELPTEVSISNSRLASQRDATDVMIESICRWMNAGDEYSARTWLNNTIAVFGQDTTTNSFMKLQADTASGLRIAFPLKTWTTIAQRLQAEAKAGKTTHGNRPIVSTPESLSRLFDAMEAAA